MAKNNIYKPIQGIGALSTTNQTKLDYIPLDLTGRAGQFLYVDKDEKVIETKEIKTFKHYEGLQSIGLVDVIFTGKTRSEIIESLVQQATANHKGDDWGFGLKISSHDTPTIHTTFGVEGYMTITNVGADHHQVLFYTNNGEIMVSSYDELNTERIPLRTIGYKEEIVYHDYSGNNPLISDFIDAFKKLQYYNWTEYIDFYMKSTSKDKCHLVHYLGDSTNTEQNHGNFWYESLTLASAT